MEDIRPAKPPMPPKKPPSSQKSVQQLTQEFRDLLSEKVCKLHDTPQHAKGATTVAAIDFSADVCTAYLGACWVLPVCSGAKSAGPMPYVREMVLEVSLVMALYSSNVMRHSLANPSLALLYNAFSQCA